MGQKVEVGGTGRDLKGGKALIGGTAYTIKKGRTLIGGTGYDVAFSSSSTWLLNNQLGDSLLDLTYADFSSGDKQFTSIQVSRYIMGGIVAYYGSTIAYAGYSWQYQAYRTITFDEEPTGALLAWLQANGTLQ